MNIRRSNAKGRIVEVDSIYWWIMIDKKKLGMYADFFISYMSFSVSQMTDIHQNLVKELNKEICTSPQGQ